jgi:hypothetical protein
MTICAKVYGALLRRRHLGLVFERWVGIARGPRYDGRRSFGIPHENYEI